MELSLAKEFIFHQHIWGEKNKIYISKDLDKLIDMNNGKLYFIYAVLDTPNGEKLTYLDRTYSGDEIFISSEPFLHKEFFLKAHPYDQVIEI